MKDFKPFLAQDWDENKLRFPMIAQPKVDGVRGLIVNDKLVGRSLKRFRNKEIRLFDHSMFTGFDGELYVGGITDPDLCRRTTSVLNSKDRPSDMNILVFDLFNVKDTYEHRLRELAHRVKWIKESYPYFKNRIHVVEGMEVVNMEDLLAVEKAFLGMGFEGVILRDIDGKYKHGRATVRENSFLRIKRFEEEEAEVKDIIEGKMNANEATINELGYIERSTHKDNMIPNGMVGSLICVQRGIEIVVGAGDMDHDTRKEYFEKPELILGKRIVFKHFKYGVKDKPRFPTFRYIKDQI